MRACVPQDIINTLEERLKPLVNAELSVLVDVLHQPELLFLEGTDARQRCESGGFISKSVWLFPLLLALTRKDGVVNASVLSCVSACAG